MNIYADPGTKVVFAYPGNGYSHDQETAAEHLKQRGEYTVKSIRVDKWHSFVWLEEVPGVAFNSVMFE